MTSANIFNCHVFLNLFCKKIDTGTSAILRPIQNWVPVDWIRICMTVCHLFIHFDKSR